MDPKRPIFFVHIPKTAGTSFRVGLEGATDAQVYDYGRRAKATSQSVRETVYRGRDVFALGERIAGAGRAVIAGHVPVTRYALLSGAPNVVAFVRDPVDHILSHYFHSRTLHDFTGSFEDFLARPRMQNMQKKALAGAVPIAALGVVGITERYEESLAVINAHFGLEIPALTLNTARKPRQYGAEKEELRARHEDRIRAVLADDIAFYRHMCALFETRLAAFEAGRAYVHGGILRADRKKMTGFAFICGSDRAVDIEIAVNGATVVEGIRANRANVALCAHGTPRRGFVQFEVALANRAAVGDRVTVHAGPDRQQIGTHTVA